MRRCGDAAVRASEQDDADADGLHLINSENCKIETRNWEEKGQVQGVHLKVLGNFHHDVFAECVAALEDPKHVVAVGKGGFSKGSELRCN